MQVILLFLVLLKYIFCVCMVLKVMYKDTLTLKLRI